MTLLNMPREMLDDIFDHVMHAIGPAQGVAIRLVCRRFDEAAERAIFRLPIPVLARQRLNKPVLIKLLHSKLRLENANSTLCCAINDTVDFLIHFTNKVELRDEYQKVLIKAAIHFTFSWDILTNLMPGGKSDARRIKENSLIAAIGTNQLPAADGILTLGANTIVRTRFFGDPLSVAALFGTKESAQIILQSQQKYDNDYFCRLRQIHALEAAAEAGRTEIIPILLGHGTFEPSVYERAIIAAIRSVQEHTAILLIHQRTPRSQLNEEKEFCLDLMRTVAECNCELVLRDIMKTTTSMIGYENLTMPVEDACRYGHTRIVQTMLSELPHRDPDAFTSSLFWAGRFGNLTMIEMLLGHLRWDKKAIVKVLAGAVSGRQYKTIDYLMEKASVETTSKVERFSDVVHSLFPYLPPPISYRSERSIPSPTEFPSFPTLERPRTPEESSQLRQAISSGDLIEAVTIYCTFGAEHPDDDLRLFSGSFTEAARNARVESLLYLCENQPPWVVSFCAKSAAVIQIFSDFGWNINKSGTGENCSPFGAYIQDEHLIRWLLNNGADPTARGDLDVNAISAAIKRGASMSLLRLLLERGRRVDVGQLLHFAVFRDQDYALEVIELLMDSDCPVNNIMFKNDPMSWVMYKGSGVGTPLHEAAQRNKVDIVSFLLQRGADPTVRSSKGQSTLEIAESNGHVEIINLLKSFPG
ncbi:MAG: hypothetical protein M1820_002370 [Bogoriella megaspora]|nr:MAG: hypothetical protein M1820_002370 [Bogoriella megaspora]